MICAEIIRNILKYAKEKSIWRRVKDFNKLFVTRLVMIVESFLLITFMSCVSEDTTFWFGSFCVLVIVAETIYLVVFNNSKDFYTFSFTFSAFSSLYIGVFWKGATLLHENGDDACSDSIFNAYLESKNCLHLSLDMCEFSFLISAIFLTTIVAAKWRTPYSSRFKMSTHSAQVVMLLSLTADVYDFLTYGMQLDIISVVGVDSIYAILFLSLIQFSFNSLAKRSFAPERPKSTFKALIEFILGTETWSILLGLFTQDIPYFIFRIYILANCGLFVDPSTQFFVLRNFLMIILAIYRIYGLFIEYKEFRLDCRNRVEPDTEKNTHESIDF